MSEEQKGINNKDNSINNVNNIDNTEKNSSATPVVTEDKSEQKGTTETIETTKNVENAETIETEKTKVKEATTVVAKPETTTAITQSDSENNIEKESEEEADTEKNGSMSIIAHLTELRKRLIRSLIAIGVGSCIAYYFIEDIMHILTGPAGKLYYMQPAEAFFTYIKVAIFVGFLFALPVVLYQIWRFVLPALIGMERYLISVIVPISLILFIAGLAFSFFFVLPAGIKFLMGFSTDELQPMFSLKQYFDFVISFLLPFGFIFELPLAIILLAKVGIVSSKFLGKQQRIVIFLTFVIGAVISPTPDVFSQSMIAVPMILLYEISYVIVRFIMKK